MKAKQFTGFIFGAFLLISAVFTEEAKANDYKAGMNRVEFKSEGEKIAGTLFLPANYKKGDKLAAVIVTGSWTSVKEQMSGLYARELAKHALATLAFDPRFWGESGGTPRFLESPQAKIQDIKNAVSFLQTLPMIDREAIGGLGVCASAGYMAYAVAEDKRLKSFATVAAWLHNPSTVGQIYNGERSVERLMKVGADARQKFERNGETEYVLASSLTDQTAAMVGADYYENQKRGRIPAWKNQFAVMGWTEWLTFDALKPAKQITVPTLFVHSDNSALADNVRKFYSQMPGQKDLFWTEGDHADFYDNQQLVSKAMQAAADHFRRSLKQRG